MKYLYPPTRMAIAQERQYSCLQGWGAPEAYIFWKFMDGSHQHNIDQVQSTYVL